MVLKGLGAGLARKGAAKLATKMRKSGVTNSLHRLGGKMQGRMGKG